MEPVTVNCPLTEPAGMNSVVERRVSLQVRSSVTGVGSKSAVTVVSPVRVSVQGAVPVQPPPLQPKKVEFTAAAARSVTVTGVVG